MRSAARGIVLYACRLHDMANPPKYLLIENVVGFEASETRAALMTTLRSNAYHVQELELSPEQFGVPYSRPRYFALCRKRPFECTVAAPVRARVRAENTVTETQLGSQQHAGSVKQVLPPPLQMQFLSKQVPLDWYNGNLLTRLPVYMHCCFRTRFSECSC